MGFSHMLFSFWALIQGISSEGNHTTWSLWVPGSISAVEGSCVIIPCTATYPSDIGKTHVTVQYKNHKFLFSTWKVLFDSEEPEKNQRHFQGRTSLVGDMSQGNCSLKIDHVKTEDTKVYYVSLKVNGQKNWNNLQKEVSLNILENAERPVISDPGNLREALPVTMNCTVKHSCPIQPPVLEWSGVNGTISDFHTLGHQGVWTYSSSITFTPSYLDCRISCKVKHVGGKSATRERLLYVKFAPRDVHIEVLTVSIIEGSPVLLSCNCKADPPVSRYEWFYLKGGKTTNLKRYTESTKVYNVTRDMQFYCIAENQLGRNQSIPMYLSVEYKPHVTAESECILSGALVQCHCVVDSNPAAKITWSVNGSTPDDTFNFTFSSHSHKATATLTGPLQAKVSIACTAWNKHGDDSYVLPYQTNAGLLWKILPAVVVLICLSALSILIVTWRCKKRRRRHVLNYHRPYIPRNLDIYQESTPLYMNYNLADNIYTNGSYQMLYENCTPCFVRTKQQQRRAVWALREVREDQHTTSEIPVYLEVI
ncbi:myelin-associated glycoprotein isoform X1 [Lepisosteus oculatus]|uniref:myelin-associated glycoprotein isoform X1 n=1 Tax=Lepisosteus oculatus TaxID=7918 RepID=UPI00371C778B